MSNNAAAAAAALVEAGQAAGTTPSPIVYVTTIVLVAGLVSGAAAYLTQPTQADPAQPALPRTPWYTFCLLGIIAAACVPLFLSVVDSSLMEHILKGNGEMAKSLLTFLGLCLLTALTARTFLDSLTRRILQQMEEIRERQDQAAQDRSKIRRDVDAAHEKIEEVAESVDEEMAPAPSPAADNGIVSTAPLPRVDQDDRKLIDALSLKQYRTVSGVTQDSGLFREDAKQRLQGLALKGVATPTASTRSGGVRWMLTPTGRALARTADDQPAP
jgi:hypothetical protein